MEKTKIPEGYQAVMPYLIVNDAAAFSEFTKQVFGATEKRKEMRDEKHIRHAEVVIGGSAVMFADSTTVYEPSTGSMFVYVNDADEAYQKALEQGAVSLGEPSDQSYGRSCGIRDPFGNTWWITSLK